MADLFIHNISKIVTPLAVDCARIERPIHEITKAAILIRNERIASVGEEAAIKRQANSDATSFDAEGCLATPGFVDCHTHPVYVGNRAAEFHLRNSGKTYQEIAAAGGGIYSTARRVHDASLEQIVHESLPRFDRSLAAGVTTIEAKSGYGLDWEGEHKLLRALETIAGQVPQRVCRTFLVHAIPESMLMDRDRFVRQVTDEMIPKVAEDRLAGFVDVFCESGAFTVDEARRVIRAGAEYGLKTTIHANQFGHSGGAFLAAEMKVSAASHLEFLSDEEIVALAEAGVSGITLPGCVFFLGSIPYAPARRMIERGMRVGVSTDMNPGSSMTESLPFCMTAAAVHQHMSPDELLWAVTLDPATILGAQDQVGSLEPGKAADIALWRVPDAESLSYYFGDLRAATVFVGGELAWEDRDGTARH